MGVCDRRGGIVAVDVGLGTLATGDGEAGGTAVVVEETGATVAAGEEMGEGDGSASQLKVKMAKSTHTNASRNGNPMMYEIMVVGI